MATFVLLRDTTGFGGWDTFDAQSQMILSMINILKTQLLWTALRSCSITLIKQCIMIITDVLQVDRLLVYSSCIAKTLFVLTTCFS